MLKIKFPSILKRKWLAGLSISIFSFLVFLFFTSPLWFFPGSKWIYDSVETVDQPSQVAIVFGAGLFRNGKPSDVLSDRLITAAELYFTNKVEKILVSGDNSTEDYDEPSAMYDFLIQWGVPAQDIAVDFAGRRTYDTCIRAKEIWQIENAILVTQAFHLPRALFLCNHFGVDSKGISATRQSYTNETSYKKRETLAKYKAILDVYLLKPDYISGEVEVL